MFTYAAVLQTNSTINNSYNCEYDIIAGILCLFAFIYFLHARHIRKQQHSIYVMILMCIFAASVGNITSGIISSKSSGGFLAVITANTAMTLYFMANTVTVALFTLYAQCINGSLHGRKRSYYYTYCSPCIIALLMIAVNIWTRLLFYYDENCVYHRGKYIYLLYIPAVIYIFEAVMSFVRNRAFIPKQKVRYLLVCLMIAVLGFVVQIIVPRLQVQLFAESLTALGMLLTLENEEQEMDPDSRLYNHNAFTDNYNTARSRGDKCTLIAVTLANFEQATASLSQWETETVLRHVAETISEVGRMRTGYRYASEKFVFMLTDTDPERQESIAEKMTAELKEVFADGWKLRDKTVIFNTLITVAKMPDDTDGITVGDLFFGENLNFSRSNVIVRTSEEVADMRRTAELRKAVRKHCKKRSFKVYYQPIWSRKTGKIVAAEALVRMIDNELGFVPPDRFISIAEENGLIGELGQIVFENVCKFYRNYSPQQYGLRWIELNVSPYQLYERDLVNRFQKTRERYDVPADFLNLELTESADIYNNGIARDNITHLRECGFSFSMDDYGTGYSNLVSLLSGDYRIIKIDRSLLLSAKDNAGKELLKKVIDSLSSLSIGILQEGVETREELEMVTDFGCQLIQGYYFSKPLPEEIFIEYLKKSV